MTGGWSIGLMWIWPLLVLGGLLLLGYVGVRLMQDIRAGRGATPSPARQILDERYARGDIDEHEYRRRRAELG
jgi:putative membrane protein